MIKHVTAKLDKLGAKNSFRLAAISSFSADALFAYYFRYEALPKTMEKSMYQMMSMQGVNPKNVPMSDINQFMEMGLNTATNLLAFALVYHFIIDLLCFLQKEKPLKYLKGYAFLAILLSVLEVTFYMISGNGMNIYTFVTTILYGFTFIATKHFLDQKKA